MKHTYYVGHSLNPKPQRNQVLTEVVEKPRFTTTRRAAIRADGSLYVNLEERQPGTIMVNGVLKTFKGRDE